MPEWDSYLIHSRRSSESGIDAAHFRRRLEVYQKRNRSNSAQYQRRREVQQKRNISDAAASHKEAQKMEVEETTYQTLEPAASLLAGGEKVASRQSARLGCMLCFGLFLFGVHYRVFQLPLNPFLRGP